MVSGLKIEQGQEEALLAQMFAEDAILLLKVVDDGLLVSVDPSGRRHDEQLPRAKCAAHPAILVRMSFLTLRLSH